MKKDLDPTKRRETIDVTKDIIEKSKTANSSHCMVADAIRAAIPYATHVSVDIQSLRFSDLRTGWRYIALTPRRVQAHILDFDIGKTPPAFQFEFKPVQVVRMRTSTTPIGPKTMTKGHNGEIGVVVGGHTPPLPKRVGGGHGTRREFGIRAFR